MHTSWAPKPTPADLLEPHAGRTIRSFLRTHSAPEDPAAVAFWNLIYDGSPSVTHYLAVLTAADLSNSDHTIAELLAGWRPSVLTDHPEAGPRIHSQPGPRQNRAGSASNFEERRP